jgi:hypothetical protein
MDSSAAVVFSEFDNMASDYRSARFDEIQRAKRPQARKVVTTDHEMPLECSSWITADAWLPTLDTAGGSMGPTFVSAMEIDESWKFHRLYFAQVIERELRIENVKQAVLSRLKDLHEIALDEELSIRGASESDFRDLVIDRFKPTNRPAVSLLENGNLRAVWKDQGGQQVGLQFRGDGWAQYVFFALTYPEGTLSTSVGRIKLSSALALIKDWRLSGLLFG